MHKLHHPHSSVRIFWFSALVTIGSLVGIFMGMGWSGLFIALILVVIEVTFSFDNAILNARVLARLSPIWHTLFLTVGIFIAIFGVRVLFPILIVMITAGVDWNTVIGMITQDSEAYGHALEKAYPQIAAFGGAFLLMLALHFFLDKERQILWFRGLEKWLQRFATFWAPAVVAFAIMGILALLPMNEHPVETIVAGGLGIASYTVLHLFIRIFEYIKSRVEKRAPNTKGKPKPQTGIVAFTSFIYLMMIDTSFSLDSVIGAFAITTNIILIAVGLGIGAFWVRSLTVFMVRRGTLNNYRYLEHGAHYTVFVLAGVMLLGIFWHVPEVIAGVVGIGVIGSAIVASVEANRRDKRLRRQRAR